MDEGSYIHMLWQLPQYLFMIAADVIFVITTMEFAFIEVLWLFARDYRLLKKRMQFLFL